ncbi:hypothetical protein K439DRAFT_1626327 [Ramaria rubella]|nr:hypothetical protein K439DRAFT_1626327 [Ramaria rubella]
MNVSFLYDDPLDTVIINSGDGTPLYDIHTPWSQSRRVSRSRPRLTTFVRRAEPTISAEQGQPEFVAEIHWRKLGLSSITFLGSTMRLNDFVRSNGILTRSRSRVITGKDGQLYKWKYERSDGQNELTVSSLTVAPKR